MEKKTEYLRAVWSKYLDKHKLGISKAAQTFIKHPQIEDHLLHFADREYQSRYMEVFHVQAPPFTGEMPPASTAYSHSGYHAVSNEELYYRFIQEHSNAILAEIYRLEEAARTTLNLKVADRIYNPFINKMGYTLANGDVIFTDENVTETTCELDKVNVKRLMAIRNILNDKE
jgi:hypothetical protein